MKNIYVFILITVFSSIVFGQTIPSYVPTNGLVGWWPFNGNANDESGNGNNGTVNGATLTADRFGNANKAYSFDGVNDFINCNFQIINNNATVSFWFYTNANYTNGPNFIETSSQFCSINQNNGSIDFAQNFNTQNYYVNSGNFNPLGNWHNIVYVANSNTNSISLYIDGILKGSTNTIGTVTPISYYLLGKRPNNTGYYSGVLDDIGIWNRALTQQEITALYTANGVGIKDPSQNTLSVYPNPAKTQITLNATTNQIGKSLKVYDALGKVVYETILKQQQYNISITHWANGIYTVAIPEQNLTYKFVKE